MVDSSICKSCFFTDAFPEVKIDQEGKCNFCVQPDDVPGKRIESAPEFMKLRQIAEDLKTKKAKYDCIIGASGGLDSSYVIYVAKKLLNLNPLVVHYDHGFNHDLANRNLVTMCEKLNIELRTIRSKKQNDCKYLKYIVKALRPAGVYWGICSFCQYILPAVTYRTLLDEKIPALLTSSNRYEAELHVSQQFKLDFLIRSMMKTGLPQFAKSIFYILLAHYYLLRLKLEFYIQPLRNLISRSPKSSQIMKVNITRYMGLDIDQMVKDLERETGWQKPETQGIPMRFDCKIEDSFINATYMKATGITVHGIIGNNMIRDGIRTKAELKKDIEHYQDIIHPSMEEILKGLELE